MASLSAPATLQKGMRFRIVFVTDGVTDLHSCPITTTTTASCRRKPPPPA